MTIGRPLLALAVLSAIAAPARASDPPPGAVMCSGCHPRSFSTATSIPVINGRNSVEITTIMEDFRSGKRTATVMDRITKGFAPDEIQAIADWLAAQT